MFYRNVLKSSSPILVSMSVLAVLVGAQIGCGEDPTPQPTAEEQMIGYWFGNLQVSRGSAEPWYYYSAIYVGASTTSITLDGVCPDGKSAVTMTRSGMTATWMGTLHCAWRTTMCPDGIVKYTSATVKFGPEAIDLELVGRAVACGPETDVRTVGMLHR